MTKDHVVPRSVLRKYKVPGSPINIQRMCRACNQDKADRAIDYRDPATHWKLIKWLDSVGLDHVEVTYVPSEYSAAA